LTILANTLEIQPLTVDPVVQVADNPPRLNLSTIGKRVRLLRVDQGLTQEALATKAKVSVGTLQKLEEAGKTGVVSRATTTARIERIAAALGVSLDDLLDQATAVKPTDPRLKDLTEEGLLIARLYRVADTHVRLHVRDVLAGRVEIPKKFDSLEDAFDAFTAGLEQQTEAPPTAPLLQKDTKRR
jgi:transcriptional regulator with XRE-family HTH domain